MFWWPVALSEEVKDIAVPVKLLGEKLVLSAISPELAPRGYCSHRLTGVWHHLRTVLLRLSRMVTTGAATSSTGLPADQDRDQHSAPMVSPRELSGLCSLFRQRQSPPPLRVRRACARRLLSGERGDAEAAKLTVTIPEVENTTDTTHLDISP
jgi:hypothetical protein